MTLTLEPPAPVGGSSALGVEAPARRRLRLPGGLLALPAVLAVAAGLLGPLAVLIGYSVGVVGDDPVTDGLNRYDEVLTDWFYLRTFLITLRMAVIVVVCSLLLAFPLALIVARSRGWVRTALVTAIVAPLLTNIVVRNLGWVVVLSDNGLANSVLGWISPGLEQRFMGSLLGITMVLVHVTTPLLVLPVLTALDRADPAQREAALVAGAHPLVVFWRVTVPQAAPGLVAGVTLTFLISMGSLVTPLLLGQGRVFVMPTLIVQQITTFQWGRAAALALLLFVIVLAVTATFQAIGRRAAGQRSARAASRAPMLRVRPFSALLRLTNRLGTFERTGKVIKAVYLVVIVAYLLLPIVMVIKSGVDSSGRLQSGFDGFTLDWIRESLSGDRFAPALWFSLRLAVVTVLLTLVLALAASWVIVRRRFPGRDALLSYLLSPLLVPQTALAVGFVLFYLALDTEPSFQRLLVAHVVVAMPYMVRVLVSALEAVDVRMEEAAASLGARPLTVFRKVTLPLIRPGLFAAVLFGFLVSFDEAAISVLIASGDTTTLPVKILGQLQFEYTPLAAAISTVMVFVVFAVVIPLERRLGIASSAMGAGAR